MQTFGLDGHHFPLLLAPSLLLQPHSLLYQVQYQATPYLIMILTEDFYNCKMPEYDEYSEELCGGGVLQPLTL